MKNRKGIILKSIGVVAFLMIAAYAQATPITYGFYNITHSSATDAGIGEAQLFVDVYANDDGQAVFHFYNKGPEASSIADVYFDGGSLLRIAQIYSGAQDEVKFAQYAKPENLPGGSSLSPAFETTAGFSADSDPPVQPNGVNPGEWVHIIFDLQDGRTLADVIAELANGELRIGIHVQGFASGGSESFINDKISVPEPGTLILLGAGLLFVGVMGRVRKGLWG